MKSIEIFAELLRADTERRGAYLRGANLQDANLQDANLRGANLRGAYLQDANLRGANLQDADLRVADLRGANLQDANLRGADLRNCFPPYADLYKYFLNIEFINGWDIYIRAVSFETGDWYISKVRWDCDLTQEALYNAKKANQPCFLTEGEP